jgi:outer membrane immunogenic protein
MGKMKAVAWGRMSQMRRILLSLFASAGLAGAACAADLPGRTTAPVFVAPVAYSWTGVYAGLQFGAAVNKSRWSSPVALFAPFLNMGGNVLAGGHVGFNWQVNHFVVGLEGQLSGMNIRDSAGSSRTRQTWLGDVDVRAGMAFDRSFLYLTSGVAFTHYTFDAIWPGLGGAQSWPGSSRTGWTVGAGLDYAFTDNWIAGFQYKYYDFGSGTSTSTAGNPVRFRETEQTVVGRLSYKFGGPAGPVLARY